ncbi:MAG: lysine--tRNA ligase, partial [Bacteroidales bacterium]|nr:lysine--tRNA ligase [Bacteroidales bacterium]
MAIELSEQEIIRRKKLEDFNNLGVNAYPADLYDVNATTKEIHEQFPLDNSLFQEVSVAGRIMNQRIMGAVSFYEL